MTLQKGDFVVASYVAKVKETGEVFDTTSEDIARKERLYKEGEMYEPKLIVVGENWVIKALDESLLTMTIGKSAIVEISPEKGFGDRDPSKIKRVPVRHLLEKDITPTIGMRVEYSGKMATVRTIGAGRVLLDFNPPLAGKTLVYDITIDSKLDRDNEKIAALIHRRIPSVPEQKFQFLVEKDVVTVNMPEESYYIEGIQVAKRGAALDIQRFIPELTIIRFVETYKSEVKKPAEKEEKVEEETKEQSTMKRAKKEATAKS